MIGLPAPARGAGGNGRSWCGPVPGWLRPPGTPHRLGRPARSHAPNAPRCSRRTTSARSSSSGRGLPPSGCRACLAAGSGSERGALPCGGESGSVEGPTGAAGLWMDRVTGRGWWMDCERSLRRLRRGAVAEQSQMWTGSATDSRRRPRWDRPVGFPSRIADVVSRQCSEPDVGTRPRIMRRLAGAGKPLLEARDGYEKSPLSQTQRVEPPVEPFRRPSRG